MIILSRTHAMASCRRPNGRAMLMIAPVLLGLAGCAVGPDYRMPGVALSSHHANARNAPPIRPGELADWWKRLGDPVLDGLIEEAIAANLDVASAKARIREARATRRQTAAGLFPQVDGGALSSHSRSSASASGGNVTSNLYQAGFDASWELDLFGQTRRGIEAADRGIEAAEESLRSTVLTLVGDVAQNYVEVRGSLARAGLARRTSALQRQTAALTRAKFEAGASSAVDVAKATALASSTAANIPTLETAFAASAHRIGVLIGRPPAAIVARLRRSAAIPSPRRNLPPGVPADVLLQRPDVRQAERQLAQATAKVAQAEAARYPSVSLTGSLVTSGIRIGDLVNGSSQFRRRSGISPMRPSTSRFSPRSRMSRTPWSVSPSNASGTGAFRPRRATTARRHDSRGSSTGREPPASSKFSMPSGRSTSPRIRCCKARC